MCFNKGITWQSNSMQEALYKWNFLKGYSQNLKAVPQPMTIHVPWIGSTNIVEMYRKMHFLSHILQGIQ